MERVGNAARSSLASTITTGSATLSVLAGHGARFPVGLFYASLSDSAGNFEIVWCTSRTGDVLTVDRQKLGTSPFAFTAGATVQHGALAHHAAMAEGAHLRGILMGNR